MIRFRRLLASAATAAAAAVSPLAAHATLTLTLDDLGTAGTDVTVVDGGAGDANGMAGVITYIGAAGAWSINVSTALGTGALADAGIDLNSVNFSTGAGNLRVAFSETDIDAGAAGAASLSAGVGGTTAGTVGYALYADDSNALFGLSSLVFSGSGGTGAFSNSGGATVALTDPFSLTMVVDIHHSGRGATSFDFAAEVPEPVSIALLGAALLGLGGVARRRKA
jgi:hypothetical protein